MYRITYHRQQNAPGGTASGKEGNMNGQQLERMHKGKGFIAALDQSGGSTPKALGLYGIPRDAYHGDEEMFDLIHQMRTRIITSPAFTSDHILGAILFQKTMDREIEGEFAADYLWNRKGILPFLKVDKGLVEEENGVQLMKPIPDLEDVLSHAIERHIFGTKMRSVIKAADPAGIKKIVEQQFEIGLKIAGAGLVPILEPEVDIHIPDKEKAEEILLAEIKSRLSTVPEEVRLMFKLTIPTVVGLYSDLMEDVRVVRIVALSGGYSRKEANEKMAQNPGLIASFSRALTEGLSVKQTQEEFDAMLGQSVLEIYEASVS